MNETNQKPIILELHEAKQDIIACINKMISVRKLPCFLIEPILFEALTQIKDGARTELEEAKQLQTTKEGDT